MTKHARLLLFVLLFSFFTIIWMERLQEIGKGNSFKSYTIRKQVCREQMVSKPMLAYLQKSEQRGVDVSSYFLETRFGTKTFVGDYTKKDFECLEKKWRHAKHWEEFVRWNKAIWDDVTYFPISEMQGEKHDISFVDSWMHERTYGGQRGHEGTDLMPRKNTPGYYPVISMTDGVVKQMGWLKKGGYRIGILAPSGAYFYYAHLDSYAKLQVGDQVRAGDLLGFMGNTGYGKEGTRGKFPTHLHVGIYIFPNGEELGVNPYSILKYLEHMRVKCVDYDEYW